MGRESFVLVSLKEEKAKKLAQVISNESCRQILDYLAEKEATESELSTTLNIPISTVHYNLKHLVDAGLVSAQEFHYSEKGKEVLHYKLSNKYVIIAPKSTFGLKEKLRSILPVAAITVAAAGIMQLFSKMFGSTSMSGPVVSSFTKTAGIAADMASEAAEPVVRATMDEAAKGMLTEAIAPSAPTALQATGGAAPAVQNMTPQIIEKTTEVVKEYTVTKYVVPDNIGLWFLFGAAFALVLYLLVDYLIKKRRMKVR